MTTNERIKTYQNVAEAIARAALELRELEDDAAAELLAYAFDCHAQARCLEDTPGREASVPTWKLIRMRDKQVDLLLSEAHELINDEAIA